MLKIPNPFPQLGVPGEHIKINPVGYDKEIETIKNLVTTNISIQPIIVNIYGEYGQGKTTFLKYLKGKFTSEWGDFCVFEKDISNFPDLENDLVLYQKAQEENKKKGIFLILDEMKHISTEGGLSEDQERFLITLRKFVDGNIDGVKSENFALCLAMHPETKVFLRDQGHYDVEQRKGTFSVNLKDVDYYTAYMLVKEHLNEMHIMNPSFSPDIDQFFDESFINAFYVLLSHVEDQNEGLKRFNGRTYSQIMFILFEFYKELQSKLTFECLKDILLGKYDDTLKLKDARLSLKDKSLVYEIKDLLNEEEEFIFDKFLFNPRWHFDSEFENVEKYVIERLIKKEYLSYRKSIILSPTQLSEIKDNELIEGLKTLENERIFLNGEKFIYFVDLADKKLLDKLKDYKIHEIYRLEEFYLNEIYSFGFASAVSPKLITYFKSDPSKKVKIFIDNFKKYINEYANFLSVTDNEFKLSDIKYKYLGLEYEIIGNIKHKLAIFFYSDEYSSLGIESYYKDLVSEFEESNFDLGILFVGPYYSGELPKGEIYIRKMENRLFIHQFSRNQFISFLEGDIEDLVDLVGSSVKLYTQEAVEKGFTLPLTGFMEKIKNKPTLFRDKFILDIEKGWKMDISGVESLEKPEILTSGVDGDGRLLKLAVDSLKNFLVLDDGNFIKGSKLSKYEKNFLDLFGDNSVPVDEINEVKRRYFSSYSRFNIEEYITLILEKKSFLKIEDNRYILLQPTDFLLDILKALDSVDIMELLNKDQDINFKRNIFDFKFVLENLKRGVSKYETGKFNYEMRKILSKIEDLEKGDMNDFNEIRKIYIDFEEKFKLKMGNVSLNDVNVSDLLNLMKNSSKLSYLYKNIDFEKLTLTELQDKIVDILISEIEYEVDRELLFALDEILDRIEVFINENSKDTYNSLKDKIEKIKNKNISEDPNKIKKSLNSLMTGSKTDLTNSQIKIVRQILEDFNQYIIDPTFITLKNAVDKYNEIDSIESAIKTYNALFIELNDFKRHDIYLDNVKTVDISSESIEKELSIIEKIAMNNPKILNDYLDFIFNSCKKGQIESILNIEADVKAKEKKDILQYLKYVKNLDSLEYFTHYMKKKMPSNNELSENELFKLISKIKESENEYISSDNEEIVNKILRNGDLRRIIYLEEYYKDNKPFEDKKVTYRMEGI